MNPPPLTTKRTLKRVAPLMGFNVAASTVYAVGGVVSAVIYNLAAKWVGGIEVEVE